MTRNPTMDAKERRRIMIVDDDRSATKILKVLLERKGQYQVHIENNPLQSFSAASEFKPQLILLDVIMPEMNGGDVATKLRNQESTKQIPIVFMSAISQPISGFPFLSKPVPYEELTACIERNAMMR